MVQKQQRRQTRSEHCRDTDAGHVFESVKIVKCSMEGTRKKTSEDQSTGRVELMNWQEAIRD